MQSALEDETDRRPRKSERREQILLELKLRPHVAIADLAARFHVSPETVRRDFEALSRDGLLNRAHGGATARIGASHPDFDERSRDRLEERERIGRLAATLIGHGDTVMIDSGSTTLQLARFIAFNGTECTVLTNSLPVAMTIGQSDAARVVMCPGDYLASESAVIGPDCIEFLARHRVDRCLIGASGLTETGPSEAVRGFAAIKRAMLTGSDAAHLLIDSDKFGRRGLARVAALQDITSVVVDAPPDPPLNKALQGAGVGILIATRKLSRETTGKRTSGT